MSTPPLLTPLTPKLRFLLGALTLAGLPAVAAGAYFLARQLGFWLLEFLFPAAAGAAYAGWFLGGYVLSLDRYSIKNLLLAGALAGTGIFIFLMASALGASLVGIFAGLSLAGWCLYEIDKFLASQARAPAWLRQLDPTRPVKEQGHIWGTAGRTERYKVTSDPVMSKQESSPNREVTVARPDNSPSAVTQRANSSLELFDESRILDDLQRIAANPSLVRQYLDTLRSTFTSRRQIDLIDQWAKQFKAGENLIQAKTGMMRAANEYRGLERENLAKDAETEATIARHLADKEEHITRAAKTKLDRQFEESTLQSRISAITNPPKELPKPELTPEQKRAQDKKNCEARIAQLKVEKQQALKSDDEEDRLRRVNVIDNALEREYERLGRLY
jgi:hypothetical protein